MALISTGIFIDGYNVQPDVLLLAAKVALLVSTEVENFSLDDLDMYVVINLLSSWSPLLLYT